MARFTYIINLTDILTLDVRDRSKTTERNAGDLRRFVAFTDSDMEQAEKSCQRAKLWL
jgi:hypothetical protein